MMPVILINILMQFVQLRYFLLHFFCLVRYELKAGQVPRAMFITLVVTQFSYKQDYNMSSYNLMNT